MIINFYTQTNINFNAKKMPSISREEIEQCVKKNMTSAEIATLFGKSRSWGCWILKRFGFRSSKRENIDNLHNILPEMIRNKYSARQIAEETGISISTVHNWVKRQFGMTYQEMYNSIFQLLRSGKSEKYIAEKLGILPGEVSALRKKWSKNYKDEMKNQALEKSVFNYAMQGMRVKDIADILNLPFRKISRMVAKIDKTLRQQAKADKKAELLKQEKLRLEKQNELFVKQCFNEGMSLEQVLEKVRIGFKTKSKVLYKRLALEKQRAEHKKIVEKILILKNFGRSNYEIAEELGVNIEQVRYYTFRRNIPESKIIQKKCKESLLLAKVENGETLSEAAASLNCSADTLSRSHRGQGKKCLNKKTRREIVAERIIEYLKQDMTLEEISQKENLTKDTIKRYIDFYQKTNKS